jgi:hypothetical protein
VTVQSVPLTVQSVPRYRNHRGLQSSSAPCELQLPYAAHTESLGRLDGLQQLQQGQHRCCC